MATDRVALGSSSEIERREEHEQQQEHDSEAKLLRDRFTLSAISIAESEARKSGMEISKVVVSCVADLAFKFTEGLAKDLEMFARHANRKCVNMEDVILSAHRNEHMSSYLRTFSNDLKAKDPPSDRKRKKETKKNDKITHLVHVSEEADGLEG